MKKREISQKKFFFKKRFSHLPTRFRWLLFLSDFKSLEERVEKSGGENRKVPHFLRLSHIFRWRHIFKRSHLCRRVGFQLLYNSSNFHCQSCNLTHDGFETTCGIVTTYTCITDSGIYLVFGLIFFLNGTLIMQRRYLRSAHPCAEIFIPLYEKIPKFIKIICRFQ